MFNIPGKAFSNHIKHEIEDHLADQQKFRIRLTVKHISRTVPLSFLYTSQVLTAN